MFLQLKRSATAARSRQWARRKQATLGSNFHSRLPKLGLLVQRIENRDVTEVLARCMFAKRHRELHRYAFDLLFIPAVIARGLISSGTGKVEFVHVKSLSRQTDAREEQ